MNNYAPPQFSMNDYAPPQESPCWEARVNAAIAELAHDLIAFSSFEDIAFRVLHHAKELTDSPFGFVGYIDPDNGAFVVPTMIRDVWESCQVSNKSITFQEFRGLWGWVLHHQQPILTNDPASDPRSSGTPPGHIPIRRFLSVPAMIGDTLVGQIALANADRPYAPTDIQMIDRLALLYALAVQRRQSEHALQKSEKRFRLLAEHAQDVLFRVRISPSFAFEYVSPALFTTLGHTPDEYYADPSLHFNGVHENDRHLFRELLENPFGVDQIVYRYIRHDGAMVWMDQRHWVICDEHGTPIAIEGISRDITAQKQMEDALRQARDAAEAGTRAKSEFLANMSHEIRTPMNAVIGMTNLLLDTPLTDEQQEYVETVRTSGEALLTLINDILDFSKIEAGKLELEYTLVHIPTCIEEAMDLVASEAARKGLNLVYIMEEDAPVALLSDGGRLRQVLVNLLSNAVKFTERGEVIVRVSGRIRDPDSDGTTMSSLSQHHADDTLVLWDVHMSVQDTGIGIPSSVLGRLFQSFTQADPSSTRRYGGSGLGLAISRRLVELMGGTIWAESQEGIGSTFHLVLTTQGHRCVATHMYHHTMISLRKRRVLILDRYESNRELLTRLLTSWGLLPSATASAEQALAWMNDGVSFDAIILDRHIDDIDDVTFLRTIAERAAPPSSLPPIILWTTILDRHAEILQRYHGTGALDSITVISMPIRPSVLSETLTSLLQPSADVISATRRSERRTAILRGDAIDHRMGQRHPLRVLVAEDNVVNQKVAIRLLSRLGYRADIASNGHEVIAALIRQWYDVVLMDVQMPEMDGITATRYIRTSWPSHEQPYIIAMTAHAMQGSRESMLQAGMDDYVSKPVRLEELIEALSKVVRHNPRVSTACFAHTLLESTISHQEH